MTTARDNGRHMVRLRIDGFRGHRLSIPLGRGINVLTGPNRAGKTSARDALSLVVSGSIPGEKTDTKTGLVETSALSECTPAAGLFTIEAIDGAGYELRFRYSEGPQQGVRDVSSSLIESRKNAEHQAAIGARYGTTSGRVLATAALDPMALKRASSEDLEREILRLCGATANDWTGARILSEIAERTWWAVPQATRTDLDDIAGPNDVRATLAGRKTPSEGKADPVALGTIEDPRTLLPALAVHVGELLTEVRSDVKGTREDVIIEVPDAPSEAEVAELDARRRAARERMTAIVTEIGRVEGRIEAERQAAAQAGPGAERAKLTAELEAMRAEMAGLIEKLRAAEMELSRAEQAAATNRDATERARAAADRAAKLEDEARARLAAAEAEEERHAGGHATTEAVPETVRRAAADLKAARARREAAEAQQVPTAHDGASDEMDRTVAERDAAIERKAAAESTGKAAAARAHDLQERRVRYAEGRCPECGGDVAHIVAEDIEPALAAAQAERSEAEAAFRAARETIKGCDERLAAMRETARRVTDEAAALRRAQEEARQAERDAQAALGRAIAAAEESERQADAARRREVQNARVQLDSATNTRVTEAATVTRLEAEAPGLAAAVASATKVRDEIAQWKSYGEQQIAAWEAKVAEVEKATPAASVPAPDHPEMVTLREQLRDAAAASEEADADHATAVEQRRAQADAQRRRDEAEARRAEAQARRTLWQRCAEQLERLEHEVMAAFVEPFVGPVNALLDAAGAAEKYGTFEARFGRRFELGFRGSDESFAPLSQLSAGHSAVVGTLIVAVAHELAGSQYRPIALDNAEAIDGETRPSFLALLSWLCAEGHVDQVLLAAVDAYDWAQTYSEAGVRVTDLRKCRIEDEQTEAQTKKTTAAAA